MILDLKDARSWDSIVSKELGNILGFSYSDTIKKNAKKIQYKDSVAEACELFSARVNRENMVEAVTRAIACNFKSVLAYHACRTNRIDDYYEKGIVPLSPIEVQQQFRNRFSSYVSQEDIGTAIAAVPIETRDCVVHIVLDDRDFIESCGHYLIYGGEYQNCLTTHLPGFSESTRDILKKIGKATVLVCLIPFSEISDLKYLVPLMMADHFFRIAHSRNEVNVIDYTVTVQQSIKPDAIIRHYCPIKIRDPYKQQAVWNDEIMEYE